MNYIKELTKYQENNFENIFNLANKKSFYFFVFFSNIFLIIAILIEYGSNGLNNVLILYLVYFGTNFLIFLIFLVKFIEKDFHFYYLMVLLQNLFHITLSFLDYDNLNRTFVSNSITNFLLMFIYIIELRHSSRINKVIVIIANSCIFIFLFMIYYLRLKDRFLFQMELIIFIKLVFFLVYKNYSEINIITNLKEIISSQEKEIMHFKSILENFKTPFISINLKNSTIFDNSLYRTIFKYDHLEEEREENIEINNKNPNFQKVLFHNVEKIEILKNFHERLNIKIDKFSILIKHFQIFKRINLVELKMQKENILDSVKIEKGDKLSDIIYFVIENKNFINNLSFLGKFEYESNKNINLNVYIRKYEVSNETIIDLNFDIQTNEDLTQKNLSNKSKLLFFAKIVHEFKTPLFTISTLINNMVFKSEKYGSSNLIMKKKLLEDILNLSNYSISLINDINDFSRNELDYEFECIYDDFNLHETIRFTFSILKTLIICNEIKKTSVIPELEISSNVPVKIRSDEKRLKQVLLNLISNSFKFTNQGKIKIKVDFNNITNEIFFSVEDTGIGIDPIYHKHVFNDYFKVNEIETAQYNTAGSGLGLNICKKIVNQLGNGDLKFESIPNKFTKFWFNIKDMKLKKSLKNVIEIKEKSLSKDYEYSISSSPPLNNKIFLSFFSDIKLKYFKIGLIPRKYMFFILIRHFIFS